MNPDKAAQELAEVIGMALRRRGPSQDYEDVLEPYASELIQGRTRLIELVVEANQLRGEIAALRTIPAADFTGASVYFYGDPDAILDAAFQSAQHQAENEKLRESIRVFSGKCDDDCDRMGHTETCQYVDVSGDLIRALDMLKRLREQNAALVLENDQLRQALKVRSAHETD